MGDGNYIGYTGASSTVVSVVADIAESLDISGFTPSIAVSSIPALAVSSIVLDAPIAVSGTILDTIAANILTTSSIVGSVTITNTPTVAISAFPANQNVSGTSLDAIETATEGVLADTDLMVSDLDAIRIDAAAMEDLLTLMRVDLGNVSGVDVSGIGATNALLATIDADTGAILADTAVMVPDIDAIKVSTASLQADLGNVSGVLNNIDSDTNTIQSDTTSIKASVAKLDDIKTAVEVAVDGAYLNVNANIAGTDFVGGAGAATAGTLRTTLATDDSSLGILEAIRAELVNGTQTIAGTVVVAVPAALGVVSNGTVGGSQRVTLANDSDGRVAVVPSKDAYLSHVYIDLDAAGDNPTTNTEVVAAPGASSKLVIYGVQGSIVGSTGTSYGNWFLSDGTTAAATTLWTGRAQGTTNTQFELTFPYGVALTTNTALNVTSTEGSGNIFINAVVYYRTEAV